MNDRIYQAKFRHLEGLYEEYEIGFNQMANTLDDVIRLRIERGLETKLREIRRYEAELNIKPQTSRIQALLPDTPPEKPPNPLPVTFQIQLTKRNNKMEIRGLSVPGGGVPLETVPYPYSLEQLPAILKALDVGKFVKKRFRDEYVTDLEKLELLRDKQLHPEVTKIVGQKLYNALFAGDVATEFEIARREGTVACQVQFDPEDIILTQFPWETVHDGRNPLTPIQGGLELTRSITFAAPPQPLTTTLPLRMLFIAPRSKDDADLGNTEATAVRQALNPFENANQIEVEILSPPTWSALEEKLSDTRYNVIHFDGHGSFVRECPKCGQAHYPSTIKCLKCDTDMTLTTSKGYLHFEDDDQNRDRVSVDELKVIIANTDIRLVVLSACGSGVVKGVSVFNGIAPGLIQIGVPAVVAMQGSPTMTITAKFMKRMYDSLVKGRRLPQAVNDGRRAIYREKPPMWFMPVVYLRSSDDSYGQLFKFDQ